MFSLFLRRTRYLTPRGSIARHCRKLSVSQTATALRPFYFAVHPDFFGKYPKERSVNEESLKKLHEYVASLQARGAAHPTKVQFFVKNGDSLGTHPGLRNVRINLASPNLRKTVETILKSFGLPLDYVNTIPDYRFTPPKYMLNWQNSSYVYNDLKYPGPDERRSKPQLERTLRRWLQGNIKQVRKFHDDSHMTQVEIDRLCGKIVAQIGVEAVRWENIWSNRHYMGCLRTFYKLCVEQTERLGEILAGRCLVFGNKTGVNVHGEVVLGSEDVTTEWMSLLLSVKAYDPVLERLPKMEQKLSELLNSIQIVRSHAHGMVMAQMYEVMLNKMLNSVSRSQDLVLRELRHEDLSHLVLVVQGESGPLTLTSGGQFLIPASIPASILVRFIVENKEDAAVHLVDTKMHMFYMEKVRDQCLRELKLLSVSQDESVTPQQMTECCQRLLDSEYELGSFLSGTQLKVSTYYTLTRDGEVTIPWDWKDETFA